MHRSFAAAAAFLLQCLEWPCLAQVLPSGSAAHVELGRVTTVDSATMNFACQGRTGNPVYWVTRATRFRAGRSGASFFDLQAGRLVEVMFHDSGTAEIADQVILLS